MSRNIDQEIDEIKEQILSYTPGSTIRFEREKPNGLPEVLRIGLFGPTGVGKSALVNSMNFATMDKSKPGFFWKSIAPEGYSDAPSKTLTREAFYIAKNIAIVDNRGMKGLGGPFMVELGHQLAGVYGDGRHDVQWNVGFLRSLVSGLERAYRASKDCKIQCTVLVFSAVNLSVKASDLTELLAQITKMTGYPPIVIITHRNHPDVKEEVLSEFRTGLQTMGIDYVQDLENYTRDNHQYNAEKHLVLLEALHQCAMVGDQVMKNKGSNGGCVIL